MTSRLFPLLLFWELSESSLLFAESLRAEREDEEGLLDSLGVFLSSPEKHESPESFTQEMQTLRMVALNLGQSSLLDGSLGQSRLRLPIPQRTHSDSRSKSTYVCGTGTNNRHTSIWSVFTGVFQELKCQSLLRWPDHVTQVSMFRF